MSALLGWHSWFVLAFFLFALLFVARRTFGRR